MARIDLTASQRRRLQAELHKARRAGYYRRLLAILELDRGKSAAEVAALLGVTRQSVYNWAHLDEESPTLPALQDQYGKGRPRVWTRELQAVLQAALQQRPEQCGCWGMNWTVPLLQDYLLRQGGQRMSEDTLRRQLQRLGYVWKRFRYVLPADPQREKKTRDPQTPALSAVPQRRAGRG